MKIELLYNSIGKVIRAYRRSRDMSQETLAKQMSISRGTLANIETGRQRIYAHQLYDVARILEVKLQDLLPLQEENVAKMKRDLPLQDNLSELQKNQIARLIGE